MGFFSKADSTDSQESEISSGAAADAAAVIGARAEFRFAPLLND